MWRCLGNWLPVLAWMGIIFSASSDSGSFQHSSRIIAPLMHWLFPHLSEQTIHGVVVAVRKGAHLTEYAILALLLWRALQNRIQPPPIGWQWPPAMWALLGTILYAATDEWHQSLVPSREGTVRDVLIDSAGGALGLLLMWLVGRLAKRWR